MAMFFHFTPLAFVESEYNAFLIERKKKQAQEEYDVPETKPEYVGLVNEGTTCYMNSLI